MKTFASLRKLWKQRPFAPFRIITDSGLRHDITSPDHIMVTKTALAVGRRKNKNDREFDSVHHLGVLNVVAIESLESPSEKRKAARDTE
jgi:hypothetical protein